MMNDRRRPYLSVCILLIGLTSALLTRGQQRQQHKQMEAMNERGDREMGFDHLKTTHHFFLRNDGGTIQVEANNAKDKQSRDEIRKHLRHIAIMFAAGNFDAPMIIHTKAPPGTEVMEQLKAEIDYAFRDTTRGALIRIATHNPNALQAIHEFLRFQIKEHMTGDSLEVQPAR